jgi:transcriptional regulator with XRE-family HTH domain
LVRDWLCPVPDSRRRMLRGVLAAVAEQPSLSFAGLLRRLRADAGLTQEELAEAARLSPRSVSDLERGINRTARKDTARLPADALGVAGPQPALFQAAARSPEQEAIGLLGPALRRPDARGRPALFATALVAATFAASSIDIARHGEPAWPRRRPRWDPGATRHRCAASWPDVHQRAPPACSCGRTSRSAAPHSTGQPRDQQGGKAAGIRRERDHGSCACLADHDDAED